MNRIIIFVLCLASSSLQGQTVRKSLAECIRMALDKNPGVMANAMSVEKSQILEKSAFDYGKTGFTLSQDPTSGGGPDNSLSISQNFSLPMVYRSQYKLLKAKTGLDKKSLAISKNDLVRDVSSVYFKLLYLLESQKIVLRQDSIYKKFLFLASAKVKAGESNVLERINAEKLYNENQLSLNNLNNDIRSTCLVLQSLICSDSVVEPSEEKLFLLDPPVSTLNAENTPTNDIWKAQSEIDKQNIKVIKTAYLPEFNISFNYQMLIKGFDFYNIDRQRFQKGNFTGAAIGISVPLFTGSIKAKAKAARRDMEITKLKQQADITALQRAYDTSLNDLSKAKNSLSYYDEKGIKQSDHIISVSQVAYEKGEINYIEYIQNLRTAIEISLQHISAMNDFNQSVVQLNYLQGYERK